ncbi:MAG: hypothetical protein ABSC31_16425, partial [Acidimicrobiales bacterium]
IPIRRHALSFEPEAGAQCGNAARWDLRGGPPARAVPTATGAFYRSRLQLLARRIDEHLVRWAMHKFKRLRHQPVKAWAWLNVVRRRSAGLFVHWHMLPPADRRLVGAV